MMMALDSILRRPRAVLAMMVFLVMSGVYAYTAIPKDARPDIQVPTYYVSIPLAGVSPEDASGKRTDEVMRSPCCGRQLAHDSYPLF